MSLIGCAGKEDPGSSQMGQQVFTSMQQAVEKASKTAKDTVALVKLKGMKSSGQRQMVMVGGRLRPRSSGGDRVVTGVVLTSDGYAVISQTIKPEDVTRIEVWLGDVEYKAKLLKSDDQLGMTVIKIDVDEPIKALNLDNISDLKTGDWCVSVQPSDENSDYEQFVSLGLCRGQISGIYREFLLDNSAGMRSGSPVVNLAGEVVGIIQKTSKVVAMSDVRADLRELLSEAAGVSSADEEARKKGWFGALVRPINKEYARKYGFSKSSLSVQHVMKGGPADLAGVETGDLLIKVNGGDMRLSGQRAYQYFLKALHPKVDQPFSVTVVRNGRELTFSGTFAKKPEDEKVRADDLGVTVKKLEDSDVALNNLFSDKGVLITEVKKGSAAAVGSNMRNSLLIRGDLITAVGGTPTPDIETFSEVLQKLRQDKPEILLVTYLRGRTTGFAALNLKIGESANDEGGQR